MTECHKSMTTDNKPIGYIKNLTDPSLVHLIYSGPRLSFAFPIGHVFELIADGGCPFKEFTEKEFNSLIVEWSYEI